MRVYITNKYLILSRYMLYKKMNLKYMYWLTSNEINLNLVNSRNLLFRKLKLKLTLKIQESL